MVFPIGAPNDGFAPYFSGKSYLAPLSTAQVGIYNVTFEPGCRNNWHIHHAAKGGGQILVCVAVPQSFRHTEVTPLGLDDLLHLGGSHNGVTGRENTVDGTELLAGALGVGAHAALAHDDADTGLLHELILELFHTHEGGGAHRHHLEFVVLYNCHSGYLSSVVQENEMSNVLTPAGGIFRRFVEPGQEVEYGQKLGVILDPFTAEVEAEITCPTSGVVFFALKKPLTTEHEVAFKVIRRLHGGCL